MVPRTPARFSLHWLCAVSAVCKFWRSLSDSARRALISASAAALSGKASLFRSAWICASLLSAFAVKDAISAVFTVIVSSAARKSISFFGSRTSSSSRRAIFFASAAICTFSPSICTARRFSCSSAAFVLSSSEIPGIRLSISLASISSVVPTVPFSFCASLLAFFVLSCALSYSALAAFTSASVGASSASTAG